MNQFILMGRLVRDPEKKNSENPVTRYTLAVDKNFGKDTEFLSCVVFGKEAEFAQKYLHKGSKILVQGRIENRFHEKNEKKIYVTDLIVEHQEFCESKKSEVK